MNTISLPSKTQYHPFFETYIGLINGTDYSQLIIQQNDQLLKLFSSKDSDWLGKSYFEGKWTPKEVLGHIIDTERMMTFRALCISRDPNTPLPGFGQDMFVSNSESSNIMIEDLLEDFLNQRKALLSMIKTLPIDKLDNMGSTDGNMITPRALLWIIPGHFAHHFSILIDRY